MLFASRVRNSTLPIQRCGTFSLSRTSARDRVFKKKIRNNIEKSNQSGQPRCLKVQGKKITWNQFKSAFNWDQESFSLPIHEKLTVQHLDL